MRSTGAVEASAPCGTWLYLGSEQGTEILHYILEMFKDLLRVVYTHNVKHALKKIRRRFKNILFWGCMALSFSTILVFSKPAESSVIGYKSTARNILSGTWKYSDSPTLIMYVLANDNEVSESNFRFFLQHGVSDRPSFHFIVIVQEGPGLKELQLDQLQLPPNVRVLSHANKCLDIGTVGWLLYESRQVQIADYRFFIWLNSSVRGPFLPTWANSTEWPALFTSQINDDTKLSGTVVSCAGIVDEFLGKRETPHLQAYVMATDAIGLQIMKQAAVLECYERYTEIIYHGELGASLSILNAGFNIHSTMLRYRGVDWRKPENSNCNRQLAPSVPGFNDGISLDPLEAVFVKVKQKQKSWESSKRALAYTSMLNVPCLECNDAIDDKARRLKERRILMKVENIFNYSYYVEQSRDLKAFPQPTLWEHFITSGFYERRPFALSNSGTFQSFPFGVESLDAILELARRKCDVQPKPSKKMSYQRAITDRARPADDTISDF